MTRTFLIALELDANDDLLDWSSEIEDSLTADGLPVTSVKPWASPLSASEEALPISLPNLGA